MELLGIIPARGGSKGIPRKNLRPFLGRPLVSWTVESARQSGVCRRLVLSTDDEEIARIGRDEGAEAPFLRPPALADDAAPTAAVVRHAVEWLRNHDGWRPDAVIVLEPTSPGRQPFHVQEAVRLLAGGADSVASIAEAPHHHATSKLLDRHPDGTITGLDGTPISRMAHRRQDVPVSYAFDGLIFACATSWVLQDPPTLWGTRVVGYLVESRYNVDLDRPEDWEAAEAKLRRVLRPQDPDPWPAGVASVGGRRSA